MENATDLQAACTDAIHELMDDMSIVILVALLNQALGRCTPEDAELVSHCSGEVLDNIRNGAITAFDLMLDDERQMLAIYARAQADSSVA